MMDWQRLIPGYWSQLKPTDHAWDEALNAALDKHIPERFSLYQTTVGPFTVWTSNWPYCYGYAREGLMDVSGLPKVATRKRLRRAIQNANRACWMRQVSA